MKASDRCRDEIDCIAGYFCNGGVHCNELSRMVPDDYECRKFNKETQFRLPRLHREEVAYQAMELSTTQLSVSPSSMAESSGCLFNELAFEERFGLVVDAE